MPETFYITTPIYYANSLPHLGHLYTTIVADAIHRYKKQRGFDVYFLTGTDEHGINIQRAAEREGRTNQAQVDYISGELKRMFAEFGLDPEHGGYDIFMRTTEPFHYAGVQHFWQEISSRPTPKGNTTIYEGFYEGWFCAPCAEYKTEGEFLLNKSDALSELSNAVIRELEMGHKLGVVDDFAIGYYPGLLKEISKAGIDRPSGISENQSEFEKRFGKHPEVSAYKLLKNYFDRIPVAENSIPLITAFQQFEESVERNDWVTPRCPVHNRSLDLVWEETYFFRLSDYDEWLIKVIETTPSLIRPEARKNEVLSFIRKGLQDLSISRRRLSVSWGVPVPGDEDHVMYVWLDALSNYITAVGYGNDRKGAFGFDKYWPAMHLVGKDILRFHTVYWFSFLKAAGLPLPAGVFAHGMWLDADGRKMGKTLGNVIEVDVLHKHFQVDAVRYFVLREMVFGQDGRFGYESLIDRATADLSNGLGNLANRTLSMIAKYRDGRIPDGKIAEENYIHARRAGIDPDGGELVSVLEHARDEFLRRFDNFEISQALETVWSVIARVDKMISDAKPWVLAKDENQAETLNAVLYRAAETLRWLSVILYPVIPDSAEKIHAQLGLGGNTTGRECAPASTAGKIDPASLRWAELPPETSIREPQAVFPRIDKAKVMNEIKQETEDKSTPPAVAGGEASTQRRRAAEPLESASDDKSPDGTSVLPALVGGAAPSNVKAGIDEDNFITIDDFLKVELRVGEVKAAERIPKADKLLRFEIDLGEEKPRQILAGLAEYYDPEILIGRKVVVVANLKPRKMRGLESQGMICAASLSEEDSPAIATFIEDVQVGSRLK